MAKSYSPPPQVVRWVEHGGFWHVDALLLIPARGPIIGLGALGGVDDDGGVTSQNKVSL